MGCDDSTGTVYVIASPDDPLRRYLYATDLPSDRSASSSSVGSVDGGGFRRITPGPEQGSLGTHTYTLSADGKYAVHSFSSAQSPPVTNIVSLPGHQVKGHVLLGAMHWVLKIPSHGYCILLFVSNLVALYSLDFFKHMNINTLFL